MSKMKKFMSALTAMTLTTVSAVSMVASAMSVSDILYEDKIVGYYNVRLYSDHCEILSCTDNTLTEVVIPDYIEGVPVTYVKYKLFMDFDNLTSVDFGSNRKILGNSMFAFCDALTEITFPEWVTRIEHAMFYDCSNLQKVVFTYKPESVKDDRNNAFDVGSYAFYNCVSLEEVITPVLEESVGSLGQIWQYAFYNCDSLESITLPKRTYITGAYEFAECDNLKSVSFNYQESGFKLESGESNFLTDRAAFSNCTNLTSVTCEGVEVEFSTEFVEPDSGFYYYIENAKSWITSEPTTETTEAETIEKVEALLTGDANCDGIVNMADAVTVLLFASKDEIDFSVYGEQFNVDLSEIAYANADVHETGNGVNASDAFVIQQYATGVIKSL